MNTDNKENQEEKKMNEQEQKVKIYVIDTGKIKQTKAFARQDGTILGTVWVISFVCTMLAESAVSTTRWTTTWRQAVRCRHAT